MVFLSFRYISVFLLKFCFFKFSLDTEVSWTGPGRCGAIGQSYRRHSSEIKLEKFLSFLDLGLDVVEQEIKTEDWRLIQKCIQLIQQALKGRVKQQR